MKSLILILFCLSVFNVSPTSGMDVDSVFSIANSKYKAKEFFEAIESYKFIEDSGYKSAELYFNLGNAHFKIGDYPRAILYYERAKLYAPLDKDVEFNLVKSRAYVVDKIEVIPEFFLKSWINDFLGIMRSNQWALISLLLFVLTLSFFLIYFLVRSTKGKKISFSIGLFIFFIFCLALYASFKTKAIIVESNAAIVLEQIVRVKGSPDSEGTDMFIIHEGVKIFVLRQVDQWSEIRLSDGKQGWMKSEYFEKI